jgi:hypothetical protein
MQDSHAQARFSCSLQLMQQLLAVLSRRCFCVWHFQSRQAMQHSK